MDPVSSMPVSWNRSSSFMVAWMRFAVAALVISAETKTLPLVAFAAMAFTFTTSPFPLDFKRSRAFGGRLYVTLNVVTS
jgi:hypothetical protein